MRAAVAQMNRQERTVPRWKPRGVQAVLRSSGAREEIVATITPAALAPGSKKPFQGSKAKGLRDNS